MGLETKFKFEWSVFTPPNPYEPESVAIKQVALFAEGKEVGSAEVEFHKKPFPFYHVWNVAVFEGERNKGYGAELVEEINNFLDKHEVLGMLKNTIDKSSLAHHLYTNRGWESLGGNSPYLTYGRKDIHSTEALLEIARTV